MWVYSFTNKKSNDFNKYSDYLFKKLIKLFLFSFGDIVGLPKSFLAPLFTIISNKQGPSCFWKSMKILSKSFNFSILKTLL